MRSVNLDVRLVRGTVLSRPAALRMIAGKYGLLAGHAIRPYRAGTSHATFGGRPYFYESRFGLAALQAALVSHVGALRASAAAEVLTVLDVGANVGYFALAMRAAYPLASIHCCEPVPSTVTILRKNVGHDENIVVHEVGLSDRSGTAVMVTESANSLVSMLDDSADVRSSQTGFDGRVSVQTQRLDDLVAEFDLGRIDVLKIDTETFEDLVLDGAPMALALTRWLFLEVTIADNDRYTISSLLGRLSSPTYDFQLVSARNFAGRSEGPVPIWDVLLRNTFLT